MTRAILSLLLCGLCLAVGLYTAEVQAHNLAKGVELDRIKRECDLLEATSERAQFEVNRRLRHLEQALPVELATREAEGVE